MAKAKSKPKAKAKSKPQARYEFYADTDGLFRWRLRSSNGKVISVSSEGYSDKRNALRGLEICREEARAEVRDLTGG